MHTRTQAQTQARSHTHAQTQAHVHMLQCADAHQPLHTASQTTPTSCAREWAGDLNKLN